MRTIRALYHLAKADFLQRTRSYGFLVTLGITLYVACLFIPPSHSAYATMEIGGHRGIYNSPYLGALMAILISPFLSLAGFYLVKNAIDRDIQTGVGQILASTPLSKPLYTVGKTISNFAVLAVMVAIMGLAAIAMQFARNEDLNLQIIPLFTPLILVSLPVMFVVGSVAVLFEAIPRLRGGLGNVVFFFLWIAVLVSRIAPAKQTGSAYFDLFGLGVLLPSIVNACQAAFPGTNANEMNIGINFRSEGWDLTTFRWDGMNWTHDLVLSRLCWMGVGLGLALLAAVFFRRFDPAQESSKQARSAKSPSKSSEHRQKQRLEAVVPQHVATLRPLAKPSRFSFPFMVRAELGLALHRLSLWWYLVAIGLIAVGLFSPLPVARGALVFAWIWPLLIWSAMGTREARWRTNQLVFSTAHPLRRQLPACWLAGVIITVLIGCGTGIRLLVAGEQSGVIAWVAGAFFIPTMALAFGVWSGSSKLFEILYLLLWYLGPANGAAEIDFMGITGPLLAPHTTAMFAAITAALLVFAVIGRRRQLVS